MADALVKRRRGRPPLHSDGAKRAWFTTRIRGALRDRLQAAADAVGHSLTQEIEWRLERSLQRGPDSPAERLAAGLREREGAWNAGVADAAAGQEPRQTFDRPDLKEAYDLGYRVEAMRRM